MEEFYDFPDLAGPPRPIPRFGHFSLFVQDRDSF